MAAAFTRNNAATIISELGKRMSRSDWLDFRSRYTEASADNLVRWHLSYRKCRLVDVWPLTMQELKNFAVDFGECIDFA